jgi:cytochrome b involved in lipid metabolism
MNTKVVLSIIGAVLIVVLGVAYFTLPSSSSYTQTPATQTNTTAPATTSAASSTQSYTMADVATHNSASSCWTAINGNVYDVTSWISQHPGGPQHILELCGVDGSAAFNGQHSGQADPAQELATFYIGTLAQ